MLRRLSPRSSGSPREPALRDADWTPPPVDMFHRACCTGIFGRGFHEAPPPLPLRARSMQKRQLGRSNLHIAPLVLGGNVFGWTTDQHASFAVLDAYAAAGGNCIDTADGYSIWVPGNKGGESETIIGEWMKRRGNRDKIIVATKVGWELSPTRKGLSRAYIIASAEGSLARLQTDYIDLYQSHRDDPDTA